MAYNPGILPELLRARSLSRDSLSKRLGMDRGQLDAELEREPEPKQGLLRDIAKELALPPFVFFMERTPPLHEAIPDFRSATPGPSAKTRATVESIQFASAVQKLAADLGALGASDRPRLEATTQHVDEFALRTLEFFGVSLKDQVDAKDARAFYTICRKKIESKGIFVLHDSFPAEDGSGFCLAHRSHPLVVVNTKQQTRGRRLFTLLHELGHVLMGRTGISDPFIHKNSVERLCNRFAGSFLVPKSHVPALLRNITPVSEPERDDVAWAARRLKISQEAAVLRLEQLGVFKVGSHHAWLTAIHNLGNPDFAEKGGGAGGPPPQEKVKLARYGFQFATAFDQLLRQGAISEIDLFRSTGLKPKYQRGYFDYARSITEGDLQALELDDE